MGEQLARPAQPLHCEAGTPARLAHLLGDEPEDRNTRALERIGEAPSDGGLAAAGTSLEQDVSWARHARAPYSRLRTEGWQSG